MTLGEQIRKKREEAQLSQEELAEQVGVSRQAVSKWESGLATPKGENARALGRVLALEEGAERETPEKGKRTVRVLGIAAAVLAAALVCALVQVGRLTAGQNAKPALESVRFFSERQEEVLPEANWYNTAEIESILLQWSGNSPFTIKMFLTPAGSETAELTELLAVKAVKDGDHAALFSAQALHGDSTMGHLWFELDFGGGTVVTETADGQDLFNVIYDPEMLPS